jgi:ferredoxin
MALAPAPALSPTETETRPVIVTRPRTVAVVAHPDRCTLCEACLDACPRVAITLGEAAKVDAVLCSGCGAYDNACPNGVFELVEV